MLNSGSPNYPSEKKLMYFLYVVSCKIYRFRSFDISNLDKLDKLLKLM